MQVHVMLWQIWLGVLELWAGIEIAMMVVNTVLRVHFGGKLPDFRRLRRVGVQSTLRASDKEPYFTDLGSRVE